LTTSAHLGFQCGNLSLKRHCSFDQTLYDFVLGGDSCRKITRTCTIWLNGNYKMTETLVIELASDILRIVLII